MGTRMVYNNSTASDYDTWREVYGDIVEDNEKKPETMNIRLALQYYASLEEKCDTLIQEQDDIIRSVMRHVPRSGDVGSAGGFYAAQPATEQPALVSTADMPYEEFREVAKLANKVVQKHMPMATNRFMRQAGPTQIDAIENMEIDIGVVRQHMTNVEVQILDTVPKTTDDIAAKLKFMSMLMLDGNDMEVDYFAYLVEECAEVLQDLRITG
jgi:hypothetical protein